MDQDLARMGTTKSQEPHGDSNNSASIPGAWPDNWQSKPGGMCQTVLAGKS